MLLDQNEINRSLCYGDEVKTAKEDLKEKTAKEEALLTEVERKTKKIQKLELQKEYLKRANEKLKKDERDERNRSD